MQLKYNIPDGFLNEETRGGYTVSSEMKKVWAVELDLLQYLLEVCERHNLRIYAEGGTLLGAVRHKGYIPWDDDIDMIMLREDYDKLMSLADEFKHPYFLQNVYTDAHYTHRHAQIRNCNTACWAKHAKKRREKYNQGIFIDIFPADNMPVCGNPAGFLELQFDPNYMTPQQTPTEHGGLCYDTEHSYTEIVDYEQHLS